MSSKRQPPENSPPLQKAEAAELLHKAENLQRMGKQQAAEQGWRRIIDGPYRGTPDPQLCSQALNSLCQLYRQRGEYAQIIACCQSLLEKLPEHIEAHYFLGAAHQLLGDEATALQQYRRVVALDPGHAAAHLNSGILLQRQQQYEEAIRHFDRVIELKPERAQGYIQLGIAAQYLGRMQTAAQALQHAVELEPEHADAHFNLGALKQKQGDFTAATACYRRALNLNPDHANACYQLADIYEMTNRLPEAEHYLQQALQLVPDHLLSRRLAATLLRRQGKIKEAITQLEEIPIPADDQLLAQSIHFELGRLYDRAEDSPRAFAHFQLGNRLLSRCPAAAHADKHAYLQMVRDLRQSFTPQWLDTWPARAIPTDRAATEPIFLIGFPRSGTTLLDQILDSHPALQVIEEQALIENIRRGLARTAAGYPAALATLDARQIRKLRQQYLDHAAHYLEAGADTRFIDKLPLNTADVGLIARLFTEARIILALRHPCDVCLSCFMQAFAPNNAMANFYTLEDTARLYAEVMGLWRQYESLLPLNYQRVKYEDIVADFAGETRRLLDFLDLPWDVHVLEYNQHARARKHINTPSYNQVTEKIYTRARYRWQRYEEQLQPVMSTLAPFIDYFDY